jgi:hypothetical protein
MPQLARLVSRQARRAPTGVNNRLPFSAGGASKTFKPAAEVEANGCFKKTGTQDFIFYLKKPQ